MKYLQEENRFYVPGAPGEKDIAEIVFHRTGDSLAEINHTFVDVNYRGQGIAQHLVEMVVEQMRKEHRKIDPICPYAKKEFERVSSYHDIWHH